MRFRHVEARRNTKKALKPPGVRCFRLKHFHEARLILRSLLQSNVHHGTHFDVKLREVRGIAVKAAQLTVIVKRASWSSTVSTSVEAASGVDSAVKVDQSALWKHQRGGPASLVFVVGNSSIGK